MRKDVETAREAGLVACRTCTKVWPMGTVRCGRCGAQLHSREPGSLSRVWAWWVAGVMAYIPANTYPMLITETLVERSAATIIGGAVEVALYGEWLIAGIILFASVVIPVAKFIAIAVLALAARSGRPANEHQRLHMYEIVEFIGRWSMIDVFVVAILVALVQLSSLASIQPGPAALAFAGSVIFTMLSAKAFDSRLIFDRPLAAETVEGAPAHGR
ncbi:MAG: paraquat-inducible protein A [Shimia sp.]